MHTICNDCTIFKKKSIITAIHSQFSQLFENGYRSLVEIFLKLITIFNRISYNIHNYLVS